MTYSEQLVHALHDQRRKALRRRDSFVVTFLLVDVVMAGAVFAWLVGHPEQPLWKTFFVAAVTMCLSVHHLWMARLHDAVAQHVTAELNVVTGRN